MPMLVDGYSTLITVAVGSIFAILREKEVQPIGVDGGGGIDTTTMRNVRMRTKAPKALVTLDDMTFHAQYDPTAYSTIVNVIMQKVGLISIVFPDGSVVSFQGWLDKFKPGSNKEGEFPTAECTIIAGNQIYPSVVDLPFTAVGATTGSTYLSRP